MKRILNLYGIVVLAAFFAVACGGSTNRSDLQGNLAEIKTDLTEVVQNIDEAIAVNDVSEFKNKADDAISDLDSRIDDYLNEMESAERRVDQDVRTKVVDIKQKKVEVEFKLALLDQNETDDFNTRDTVNGVGVYDDTDRRVTTDRDRTTATGNDPTATGTTVNPGTGAGTVDNTVPRTDERGYAQDPNADMYGDTINTERDREIIYGPELVNDIKDDLRNLRNDVEEFLQANLE